MVPRGFEPKKTLKTLKNLGIKTAKNRHLAPPIGPLGAKFEDDADASAAIFDEPHKWSS
jgi:hypothetical protein